MKDMLTTTSSIIIILFCCSLLFLSDDAATSQEEPGMLTNRNASEYRKTPHPLAKTTLFKRVQSVRMQKGVLMFVTSDQEGLKEHYFLIRDKNVILIKEKAVDMPHNSIKFEDDGYNTLRVTIPDRFKINLMEEMTSIY